MVNDKPGAPSCCPRRRRRRRRPRRLRSSPSLRPALLRLQLPPVPPPVTAHRAAPPQRLRKDVRVGSGLSYRPKRRMRFGRPLALGGAKSRKDD